MISIEQLNFVDLNGLKLLYNDGFEGSDSDLNQMTDIFNQIKNNPSYIILCAKFENEIAGSVMGIVCNELFGKCIPFMVVENVAVLKKYRRRGIAKQLLLKLEELAISMNCSTILFVSSAHRTGAHKLYESLGYSIDKVNGYRKRLNN
jgi:ribosomal protein S18 acetylase RimI-like enzyme